jgi:hypothetical protein
MKWSVQKLPDQPIVIVALEGSFDPYSEVVTDIDEQVCDMATLENTTLYGILDARQMDIAFCDILLWVQRHREGHISMFLHPHMQSVIVGTHPLIEVGVKKAKTFFNLEVRQFVTLPDALNYISGQIQDRTPVI